jgi:hypothetical protein
MNCLLLQRTGTPLLQEVRLTEHFNRNSADVFSSARIKATFIHAMAVVKLEVRITVETVESLSAPPCTPQRQSIK